MLNKKIFANNLIENAKKIKFLAKNKKICAVVKANAYGLGVKKVARILSDYVDYFAVNNVFEAKQIASYQKPVLILMPINQLLRFENCEYVVDSFGYLQKIQQLAQKVGKCASVHLKINSGFNRLGVGNIEAQKCVDFLSKTSNVKLVGVCTHFAKTNGKNFLKACKKFYQIINELNIPKDILIHCESSGAILNKKCNGNMVRVGIALYGGTKGFLPVIEANSKVIAIRNLKRGDKISYDCKFVAHKKMKIAVAKLGYADGVFRNFWKNGNFYINNIKCKILGKICMNMTMIEVSNLQIKIGDKVEYLGNNQTISDVAKICKTISYEILTNLKN